MNYYYNLGLFFNKIVREFPQNRALKFSKEENYTFDELNLRSNKFSKYLTALNLKQSDVICISGIKNIDIFSLIVACLKNGIVYSILDPESPLERLTKIINRCLPKYVFLDSSLYKKLNDNYNDPISIMIDIESIDTLSSINEYNDCDVEINSELTGEIPAYIMFTSGSTGFPKGAIITHSNLINFINWSKETFGITSLDVNTNVNPLYFDNFVFDFYTTIFSGACLVPFSKETVTDPVLLVKMIDELKCTSWFSVPSLLIYLQTLRVLNKNNFKNIKKIIFGGEGYPKAKLNELFKLYSKQAVLYNVYGPTECTCMCSSYVVSQDDFIDLQGYPPLGKIAKNFSYLILDEDGKKVKDDEVGELCLLGPNVGKGYYNDPERTALGFVQNPYNSAYTEIMNKTGDLVRYEPNEKKIFILGRTDNQIKHMGYRIELEEIENAINTFPFVKQSAVFQIKNGTISNIIAVVSVSKHVDPKIIRKDLEKIIPSYMIPTKFHIEEELPKNQNGKIDRKRIKEIYN